VVAGVLDHAAELFGPEVRNRVVDVGAAEDVRGDHLRGVQRRVPVLHPQPGAEPQRDERGAVPRRVDAGQRGAQAGIDGDAVVQGHARAGQPAHRGANADRGDDLVHRQPAAGQREAAGLDGLHGGAGAQFHAGLLVPAGGARPDGGAERHGERRGTRLHDGHPAAGRRGGGRQFGADPPGADDREPQPGPQQRAQRQRVVVSPQEPLRPGSWQRHGERARRQNQMVKRVLITICDERGPGGRLEG